MTEGLLSSYKKPHLAVNGYAWTSMPEPNRADFVCFISSALVNRGGIMKTVLAECVIFMALSLFALPNAGLMFN